MQYLKIFVGLWLVLSFVAVSASEKSVYFIAPIDGAKLTSPITVKFGLKGWTV